jgi:hypothetical protein
VFFAGALTSSVFEWLHPLTSIRVTNASGKVIKFLDITYRGDGDHQGRIAENMKSGQTIYFKWATQGEASYRLHVTFEDGTEVHGGAGYLERGDVIKETVEAERVKSELPMWFTLGTLYHEPWDTTDREGNRKPTLCANITR